VYGVAWQGRSRLVFRKLGGLRRDSLTCCLLPTGYGILVPHDYTHLAP